MAGSLNTTAIDNKVGALPKDTRGVSIQVASRNTTQDATATPKVSPLALTVTPVALTVPTNAIGVKFTAESDDVCHGENSTLDATSPADGQGCDVLYEGSPEIIALAAMSTYYVRARNDNAVLFFRWIFAGSAS